MPRPRGKRKSKLGTMLFGRRGLLRGPRKLLLGKRVFGGSTYDTHLRDLRRSYRRRRRK